MSYFGIRVSSNIPLHDGFVSDPEFEIELREAEWPSPTIRSNTGACVRDVVHRLPNEGRLEIDHGTAVLYRECAMGHGRAAEILGGPGFGLAAFLRGYAVLHGSAVIIGGRAVSFVGLSGAGKSTIAAAAVRAGAGFCSDGMTLIDLQLGACHSGPGRWKLRADSVTALEQSACELQRVCDGSAKWFLTAPPPVSGRISSVLVLGEGDGPYVEWLSPAEGVLQLMVHCYSVQALLPAHEALIFERMTRLATRVRVGRFTRPLEWDRMPELGRWIVNNL